MNRLRIITLFATVFCFIANAFAANPVQKMLERIDPGASKKFDIVITKSPEDFFEISQKGSKIKINANNYVNAAVGVNWYLKHYAGIHLSWNGMKAKLPDTLPAVTKPERHTTDLGMRYDFNYCTYSYTMPFWDWNRWEEEIDWMALHGVNMPLAIVGMECVWRNMLLQIGYTNDEVNEFISGPAFIAWWAMNNLEGWGGPNPDSWYAQQEKLQKKILKRMKEYGMQPVLPGFSGMMPHNADEKLGLDLVKAKKLWNGFVRPAFLLPTDPKFVELAKIYYDEQKKLYGTADYYSMDPFHELSMDVDFDFAAGGKVIMDVMKKANPKAAWVIQSWNENPRQELLNALQPGDLIVLDLFSECRPKWGMKSPMKNETGYGDHKWLFCLLENYGGNVGLHGRMDSLLDYFKEARTNPKGKELAGFGFTMEGSENNPVMFEMMSELPWLDSIPTKEDWLKGYAFARYGVNDPAIDKAWEVLANSIYNCPPHSIQQGTTESIFCCRPTTDNFQASSWSKMKKYYDPAATAEAAKLMVSVADKYKGNNNFEYDLIDILRQAIADHARLTYQHAMADYKTFNREGFKTNSQKFIKLLKLQDELLGTRPEFGVGRWIEFARNAGNTQAEKDLYEWNARVQVTTWGARKNANEGKLRDYAHKEWNGMLKDFYLPRWEAFFQTLTDELDGKGDAVEVDYYSIEEPWTLQHNSYPSTPQGDVVETAKRIYAEIFK